jgi:hypothetical protein
MAQSTDGTISYGTGEGGFTNLSGTRNGSPAFIGGGIFKSSNKGGSAFNVLSIAKDNRFQVCNTMVAHPTENKIYIGTETGLYSITDGTTLKTISNGSTKEIKIDKNGVLWKSKESDPNQSATFTVLKQASDNTGDYSLFECTFSCKVWTYDVQLAQDISININNAVVRAWFKK